MNIPVVKKLVQERSLQEIRDAASAFEKTRANPLQVEGKDDGEIMSNLLVAEFVRERMDQGTDINAALREYGQRVKGIFGGGGGFKR